MHMQRGTLSTLTARERQALYLLSEGLSTREMAQSMQISIPTVRNHVQRILRKLGVHSKLAAVAAVNRSGELEALGSGR